MRTGRFIATGLVLLMAGCAHKADKKLDEQLAQTPDVKNRAELREKTEDKIENDASLSADQKTKLIQLRDSTRAENDKLQKESLKLRSLLVDKLLTTDYKQSDVDAIKKRMKDIENERLSLTFKNIDEANKILGRDPARDERKRAVFYDLMVRPSVM